MIWLYRLLWLLLLPAILLWLLVRIAQGKEDVTRLAERLGFCTKHHNAEKVLWIHASSVGESLSVLPLAKRLVENDKDLHITITTGTCTSANLLASRLPQIDDERLAHKYVPLDFAPCVWLFLKYLKPKASVFVESEFWPELISQAPNPVLLNARLSDRSFPKYQKYGFFFKPLFQKFKACLAQTDEDAERAEKLGFANVQAAGNLKFDAPPLAVHEPQLNQIAPLAEKRKVVVYASTHEGEEALFAELHANLSREVPSLLSIIVPRHPERGAGIMKMLADKGYVVPEKGAGYVTEAKENLALQRSHGFMPEVGCEIYVADTLGELGLWFRVANSVVMGGSFFDLGKVSGHNPLEPLRLHAPTVVGPYMNNFKEMLDILQKKAVLPQVQSTDKLQPWLQETLNLSARDEKQSRSEIKAAMVDLGGSIDAAVQTLEKIIKTDTHAHSPNLLAG